MIWHCDFSSERGGQANLFEKVLYPGFHVSVYSLCRNCALLGK